MDIGETARPDAGAASRTVGGRYVLHEPLGEGGMASVHRAHDPVLGRAVAVKLLHAELARDPSFRERFRREAQAVAALNHPGIVAVHDSGEDADETGVLQYIVLEYVRGRPLTALLREAASASADASGTASASGARRGVLALDHALELTASVLDALAFSHRQGVVHRDIKPANVMVTGEGTVKVMDFGIARALQSGATAMTRTGTVLGTPQYLSPEQALGRPADARSDLYSVGCMLFELTTGEVPFAGESTLGVLYQHVQQAPPVPSEVNPALPPALDAVLARALSKDPADRYPDAEAMAADLRRITTGEARTEQLRPAGPPPHEAPTMTAGQARTRSLPPQDPPYEGAPVAGLHITLPPGWDAGGPHRRRAGRVALTGVVAATVLTIAGLGIGLVALLPHLPFGFSGSASRTPDPRATGALAGCAPLSWNVPSLRGMSPAEARTCAEIAGLKLEEDSAPGTKDDKDTVLKQEPEAYRSVKSGSTLRIWVSAGGDPRAVGELANCEVEESHGKVFNRGFTGMTAAKARECADIAHLKLEEAGTVRDKRTPAGQVARQEPGSETVTVGSTVKVWISSGGDPRATGALSDCDAGAPDGRPEVPNLVSMTAEDARACAEIAHLKLEEHTVADPIWDAGKVAKQEPGSFATVDPGSTVKIWISSGSR
ncbi:PASTA domain-containing protein [Kitasatospora sp. NPDC050543]|uniref:protein kinase domain-containing protein n=1 Tax=Kitasatospora sp. NPDC050543 TaxID=3364054 RepID=UPI00379DCFD0